MYSHKRFNVAPHFSREAEFRSYNSKNYLMDYFDNIFVGLKSEGNLNSQEGLIKIGNFIGFIYIMLFDHTTIGKLFKFKALNMSTKEIALSRQLRG